MKFSPKKGDKVWVCYDGKASRAVDGLVLQHRGFAIQVQFDQYVGDEKNIKQWFVRTSNESFGAYVSVEKSIMRGLFGLPGDWYSILEPKEDLYV